MNTKKRMPDIHPFPPRRSISKITFGALIFLIFSLLTILPVTGADSNAAPVPWPHENSDLAPDPALRFGRLENGMRFVMMENREPRDRVSMHLVVGAGSYHEADHQRGIAHFLEHMLFNGSRNFPPGELVKYFQRIGMQFGPDANASTGFFHTTYDILLPDGKTESLLDGLRVLRDYADGALLLESEIDREREVILAEKRSRDSSAYRTFVNTIRFEMSGSRIPLRLPIGVESVIRTSTRSDFLDFYKGWYRPEKITLVLVGDFDLQHAATLIRQQFSDFQAAVPAPPDPGFGSIEHQGLRGYYHFEQENGSTTVSIETLTNAAPVNDSLALQAKRLKQRIADTLVQYRLDALVRKPESPITAAYIGSGRYFRYVDYSEISAQCEPEDWEDSIALLERTMRQVEKFGFTDAELLRVKREILSDLETSVRKAKTRDSNRLAREIIRHINADRVFMSPRQELEFFAPIIRALTLDEVHAVFRRTWSPSHRLILVTGNADLTGETEAPAQRIVSAYRSSRKTIVSPPSTDETVAFPYLPEPKDGGVVVNTSFLPDLDVRQVDFGNGLRLNLKRTDFKKDEVSAVLTIGGGSRREPPEKAGLSYLAPRILNESGLGGMTRDELEKSLAGKNTRVFLTRKEDRFQFEGRTVTAEVRLLFQLLRSYLLDPAFRPEAFDLVRQRYLQKYRSMSASVEGGMMLHGRRFLAGGDTRFGLPDMTEISRLSLSDTVEFLDEYLKNGPLELSIVGDFSPDEVIAMAGRYLGTLPERRRSFLAEPVPAPTFPKGKSLDIPVPSRIPKSQLIIAYPTDDVWNIHRTRRLMILASILDDRLRETIRERLGAAYSPVSYNAPSRAYRGYGFLQVSITLNPDQVSDIIGAVAEIAKDLATHGVSQEELDRALSPTLTGLKELRRENYYWLETVLVGSRAHPQQLDWSRSILDDYASIRVEEVNRLARRFLQTDASATVVFTPQKAAAEKGKTDT